MGRLFLLVMIILFLNGVSEAEVKTRLVESNYNPYEDTRFCVDDGSLWAGFYDRQRQLKLVDLIKRKEWVINKGVELEAKGFVLECDGEKRYILWRRKSREGKKVLLSTLDTRSGDIRQMLLDDKRTQALEIMKLRAQDGKIRAFWIGEQRIDNEQYHIFGVCSNDGGKSFSEPVNLTKGYDNTTYYDVVFDGRQTYVFTNAKNEGKRWLLFVKGDKECRWQKPVRIKEIGTIIIFIDAFKVKGRLHVFWFNSYGGGKYLIEGAYSDDDGTTWHTYPLKGTEGMDVGMMKVAVDREGGIYIAYSAKKEEKEKMDVYLLASDDNGQSWTGPIRLRHYPFKNTHAENPQIAVSEDGKVVTVVWVDFRNIRSNLYMQYSLDKGKTWQQKDIPLEEPGRFNTRYNPFYDLLQWGGDGKFYLLAHRFKTDALEETELLLFEFTIPEGGMR